jgi:CarD family transcriptional regulator, regulator of rRNA transcription
MTAKKTAARPAATKKTVVRPVAVKTALEKSKKRVELHAVPKPAPVAEVKKPTQRQGFKTNEFIVYPAHGVGQIVSIEEQEVAGYKLELFVINFVKDKMTLRVPTAKISSVGMRKLAETPMVRRALETLKGRARIKRTMWSRRAQEYEAKINSGDIVAIAEVVRDLYRSESQPEQSYSERQLYEAALDRLAREISAVQRITETEAVKEIEAALAKGPRRGPKPEAEEALIEDEAA